MKKHYVTFYSPGTFLAETTTREIGKWDVRKAVKMAEDIVERYNASPYGFKFTTRERKAKEMDSRQVKASGFFFLGSMGGTVT